MGFLIYQVAEESYSFRKAASEFRVLKKVLNTFFQETAVLLQET